MCFINVKWISTKLLLNTWSQGTLLTPMDELNGEIEPVSCFKCHMSLPVLIPPPPFLEAWTLSKLTCQTMLHLFLCNPCQTPFIVLNHRVDPIFMTLKVLFGCHPFSPNK